MSIRSNSQPTALRRYLRTGEYDCEFRGWQGDNFLERARNGIATLREALIRTVRARTASLDLSTHSVTCDTVELTRRKVAPMVRGLFPPHEQSAVMAMFERAVVFLTPANIEEVLRATSWPRTAWSLADIYLASVGAERASQSVPRIVGLSEGTTCYVGLDYFSDPDPFADFVVHEAAHVFHNCKRATLGLRATRRSEWLLDVDFAHRETFAYACEAFSRIIATAGTLSARREALARHAHGPPPTDRSVDPREYFEILGEAVEARNGWRRILLLCAPSRTI